MRLPETIQALFMPTTSVEIKLSPQQALIVQLISTQKGEITGYDLVKKSNGKLTLGGIYTHLDRLERKGVIESRFEVATEGVRRVPKRFVRLNSGITSRKRSKGHDESQIPKGIAAAHAAPG